MVDWCIKFHHSTDFDTYVGECWKGLWALFLSGGGCAAMGDSPLPWIYLGVASECVLSPYAVLPLLPPSLTAEPWYLRDKLLRWTSFGAAIKVTSRNSVWSCFLNFGLAQVSLIPGGRPWFYVGYVVALVWSSILFCIPSVYLCCPTWNQFSWVSCIVFVYRRWIFPVFAYDNSFVWCLLITCFGSSKLLIVYDLFLYLGRASARITRLRGPK
jgi:hypothetical protein